MLMFAYRGIAMTDGAGRNEDKGARGELDDEVEFLENEVTAEPWIIIPQGPYGTPALRDVLGVAMTTGAAPGSEVEGTGREDAVREGRLAGGVVVVQGLEFGRIISIHFGSVGMKSSYRVEEGERVYKGGARMGGHLQLEKPAMRRKGLLRRSLPT